jgi:predicted transcriptional regulator
MEIQQILTSLGLQKNESVLYMTLLEKGTASIAEIVQITGIHRPIVYKLLPALVQKNLVLISVRGKRKLYSAESPHHLKMLAEKVNTELDKLLPDLVGLYDNRNPRPKIKFFEGEKVVAWVYEDVLATCKKGDIFYRYESPKDYAKNDKHLPPGYFDRICHKKEIQKFIITNEKTARNKPRVLERISKFVPEKYDLFEYDITQIVYNNKVAFVDFNSTTAWIIENASFAKFQRQLFKLLFEKL